VTVATPSDKNSKAQTRAERGARRPGASDSSPRVDFSRIGCVGWVLLIGLLAAGAWFWRYTLGGLYMGLATGAYHGVRVLDRAFWATWLDGLPWVGWVLAGGLIGAVVGFFTIAPVYGLRRGRWAILAAAPVIIVALALTSSPPTVGTLTSAVPDTMGPYVRTGGSVRAERGEQVLLDFLVLDQSAFAKVRIVITNRETGQNVAVLKVGQVKTGKWHRQPFRCRLKPGIYTYTVEAVDALGQPAVRDGKSKIRVRQG
jgi:hypothetical protein